MSSAGGPSSDAVARAAFERAAGAVDRELAGSLELATLFDQTRQPVVLENEEFGRAREILARSLDAPSFGALERLYAAIPEVEAAMERRGPANTLKEADRSIVEAWEGDAREAQHLLRAPLAAAPLAAPVPSAPVTSLLDAVRRLFGRR